MRLNIMIKNQLAFHARQKELVDSVFSAGAEETRRAFGLATMSRNRFVSMLETARHWRLTFHYRNWSDNIFWPDTIRMLIGFQSQSPTFASVCASSK